MIRLNVMTEQTWVEVLPGVRLLCDPLSSTVMTTAQWSPAMRAVPDDANAMGRLLAMATEVAVLVVRDWEGVAGDDDAPVAVTPLTVAALMRVPEVRQAFTLQYLSQQYAVNEEKKGFAPAPSGTSGRTRARTIAKAAPSHATDVSTSNTRRKLLRAGKSGT